MIGRGIGAAISVVVVDQLSKHLVLQHFGEQGCGAHREIVTGFFDLVLTCNRGMSFGLFNTGGTNDNGGYSDPKLDGLINATEYGSSTQAFYQYEDYAAQQLPWLWIPLESNVWVYKSNLAGFAPLNPVSGGLNPEAWYYTK